MAIHRAKRIVSLDVLRGFACTLVLIGHMPIYYPGVHPIVRTAVSSVKRCGWLGVDLFFVLSGLLISGLLFKEIQERGSINYPRFWIRRGMKIWPSYFVAFGFLIAARTLDAWLFGAKHDLTKLYRSILPNTFFLQNYVECWRWPHSWSIAVEEHFYTLLPLLLIILVFNNRLRWLPAIVGCICISVLGIRLIHTSFGANWEDIKYPTHHHIDSLLFGVFLGYLFSFHRSKLERLKPWWPLAVATTLCVFITIRFMGIRQYPYLYAIGFTVIYLAFGLLVLMARLHPDWDKVGPKWLRAVSTSLAFIGVYSYTIYLAHGVVFKLPYLEDMLLLIDHPAWQPCLFVIGSILAGILLSHVVERPFLVLRDRWAPTASKARVSTESIQIQPVTGSSVIAAINSS